MKSTILLIFLLSFISLFGKNNIPLGDWQYFDTDSNYYEITITEKHIYIYVDSATPTKLKVKFKNDNLSFGKEKWKIKFNQPDRMEVISKSNEMLTIYKLIESQNEIKDFYDWVNAPFRNGNGVMIYWRHATDRKTDLKSKIKNGT